LGQPSTIATVVKDGQVSADRNIGQKGETTLNKKVKWKYFTYFKFFFYFTKIFTHQKVLDAFLLRAWHRNLQGPEDD
jgi:hypothetical protein